MKHFAEIGYYYSEKLEGLCIHWGDGKWTLPDPCVHPCGTEYYESDIDWSDSALEYNWDYLGPL